MSANVEDVLDAVRSLPPDEQLRVLQNLARSLNRSWSPLVEPSANFWSTRSIEELAAEQSVPTVSSLDRLAMPDWPADESADELIAYIRLQREADRGA